jgi:hypothetical protein
MNNFINRFFKEKEIDFKQWELTSKDGTNHIIDNKLVIDYLKKNPEQGKQAEPILRQIDFKNGDVNHFLKYIAQFIVDTY